MRTRVAALITLAFAAISQAAPSGFADSSSRLDARANTGDCPVPKCVPALPPPLTTSLTCGCRPLTGACRQVCKTNETPQFCRSRCIFSLDPVADLLVLPPAGLCLCKAPFVARTEQRTRFCEPVCTSGYVASFPRVCSRAQSAHVFRHRFRVNAAGTGCECPETSFLTTAGDCVTTCPGASFGVPSTAAGTRKSSPAAAHFFADAILAASTCTPCSDTKAATCSSTESLSCVPGFSPTAGICKRTITDCIRNYYLDTTGT